MAGFISGGREALLSSCNAATVVSNNFDCENMSPAVRSLAICQGLPAAYLSVYQLEDQFDLVPLDVLGFHLRGNPSFRRIGLPCPRTDIIAMCHSTSERGPLEGRQRGEQRLQCGQGQVCLRWGRDPSSLSDKGTARRFSKARA